MTKSKRDLSKIKALKERGTLNPHPEKVSDPLFQQTQFFDPLDLLQVKYEMLRRVRVEGFSVARAARCFGLSRPSFYQALKSFSRQGIGGLLPSKTGPRQAHKLSPSVVDFINGQRKDNPAIKAKNLVALIEHQFHIRVHPRSIERALMRLEKKTL
jgi:transposase